MIIIDGVFFQINSTGIARVWQNLLQEWVKSGFANQILVLDRGNTAPKIEAINYYQIEIYNYTKSALDSANLQSICDQFQAKVFISTYYTTPIHTPSILLIHDMIPEVLGMDLSEVEWPEKYYSILHASKYLAVSQNTAQDLKQFFPYISPKLITVVYNGVDDNFYPEKTEYIDNFKAKFNLTKPYFLFVGTRLSYNNYKNAILLFRAFNQFAHNKDISIVCVGGDRHLEIELAELVNNEMSIHLIRLNDDELRCAYSGAIALVYPSRYEGFGLPILEAMACGCPVITCPNSSIPEVAGEAALYVSEFSTEEMLIALGKVQITEIRDTLIKAGFAQIKQFSWSKMANKIAEILTQTAKELQGDKITNTKLVWQKLRQEQKQKQELYFLNNNNLEKIETLETEIKNLRKETEYLSTTKAAFRTIIKNLLKKIGIFNIFYRNQKLWTRLYNFLLQDDWQPNTIIDSKFQKIENNDE